MLIGLVGHKGAGKTSITNAALTVMPYDSWVRIGLADPITEMLITMGVPKAVARNKKRWDEPLEILCGKTMRQAARTLGTDWGRELVGLNVWTGLALERVKRFERDGKHVVIDNVRFHSEFNAIKRAGGVMIAFRRPFHELSPEEMAEPSERDIPDIQRKCDYHFSNEHAVRRSAARFRALLINAYEQRRAAVAMAAVGYCPPGPQR